MRVTVVGALLLFLASPVVAQDRSADEKAIRELVQKLDSHQDEGVPRRSDWVFWSGALVRPVVRGQGKAEPRPSNMPPGQRINEKQTTKIVQLKIAPSGDMAYEYGDFVLTFTRKDTGENRRVEGSLLRVWQKVDGKWHVAAWFQQPYNTQPPR